MEKRVIKFRAKKDDMSNCNYVYGELVYDAIGTPRITHKDFSGKGLLFNSCIKGTEGQYTGIKDLKGTEIYEGDLVELIQTDCDGTDIKDVYEVVYTAPEFKLKAINSSIFKKGAEVYFLQEVTVIGNIYENK